MTSVHGPYPRKLSLHTPCPTVPTLAVIPKLALDTLPTHTINNTITIPLSMSHTFAGSKEIQI